MVEIIAEAGLEHCGDFERALALVDAASRVGADVIKFQTSVAELEATPQAVFQNGSNQIEVIRKMQLTDDQHEKLAAYCVGVGIEFMSTPADVVSLQMLVERCKMKRIKIGSDNLTNPIMLRAAADSGRPILLSTGMAALSDVTWAWSLLVNRGVKPKAITVMQCTSRYPATLREARIDVLHRYRRLFGGPLGFSDHTEGWIAALVALGAGAQVFEKHFTLDKNRGGPDAGMSASPAELAEYVSLIHEGDVAFGLFAEKRETRDEAEVRKFVGKSIVADCDIDAGQVFMPEMLAIKRPGTGLRPQTYDALIGQRARRSYKKDEMIE